MNIFCSGIGGIGLSAYASLQKVAGHTVSGSDRSMSTLLGDVQNLGINVTTDQSGSAIPEGCDLLVYSEAIPEDAAERVEAKKQGVRQVSYPQALGELSNGYRVIAVCGTHGKSSTTGMSARLLLELGMDPTIVVGTKLKELDGRNWHKGSSDLFLLEACEYKRSFHHYTPSIILLTNADGDHFDYYESEEDYRQSFVDFAQRLPKTGALVTHMGDPHCREIAERSEASTVDADSFPMLTLQTPGEHMKKNAQLVLGLAEVLQIPGVNAEKAVSGYAGSWRRLEQRGMWKGKVPVIDDYAHHPVEIRATIEAIRSANHGRRIVAVFQPHTHDRTTKLYRDFTRCFPGVDLLFVTDVYDARKQYDMEQVNMPRFVGDIGRESGVATGWTGSLTATKARLEEELREGDVLLCMGAGDVTNMAGELVKQ